MIEIVDERPADAATIEKMLDEAFGLKRKRKTSYRFRQRLLPSAGLSLVAVEHGTLVGTIRHWPVAITSEDQRNPALLLGPLAVATQHRGRGIGARLIESGLARARAAGHDLIILVGDLSYYQRFGFRRASELGIMMPSEKPSRVLALSLSGTSSPAAGTISHAGPSADSHRTAA